MFAPYLNTIYDPTALHSNNVPWGYPYTDLTWKPGMPLPQRPVYRSYFDIIAQNNALAQQYQNNFRNIGTTPMNKTPIPGPGPGPGKADVSKKPKEPKEKKP